MSLILCLANLGLGLLGLYQLVHGSPAPLVDLVLMVLNFGAAWFLWVVDLRPRFRK